MFLLRFPSPARIARFLQQCRNLPLSYEPIGVVRERPPSGRFDEASVPIGHGRDDFERARCALLAWKHFDVGWVQIFPAQPPVERGTVVAVLIRHFGFWSLNGAQVLYTSGQDAERMTSGFAYGTLTNHAESGEELFEVFLDPQSDAVIYRIRAVSRAQSLITWIGHPIVRILQARFRRDSAAAMTRAVRRGVAPSSCVEASS
jgi:uncharacterized protein (UPF0548 family)